MRLFSAPSGTARAFRASRPQKPQYAAIAFGMALLAAPLISNAADIAYTNGGADDLWTNTSNWNNATVPNDSSTGASFNKEGTLVKIDTSTSATCKGFMLGMYGKTNTAEISGGTLNCSWIDVGRANQNGGSGTLILSGGDVIVSGNLKIPTQFGSQNDPNNLGSGHIDLLNGTLTAGSIHIGSGQTGNNGGNGSIYITDGTLIVNGDKESLIQGYIDDGTITTANDRTLSLDYNISTSGKTTLSTSITPVATNIDHVYDGAGSDNLWANADNWTNDLMPNHSSNGAAFSNEGTHVLINSVATCRGFMLGMYGKTNTAEISGGSLTAEWFDIGRCNQNGGNGTLTITNGDVTVNGTISIPTQFSSHIDPNNLGSGHIDLVNGTLTANDLRMGNGQIGQNGGNGSIAITDGTLTLNGDKDSLLQGYIDAGYITTDSNRVFALDYDLIASGQTTLRSLQTNIDYVYTQAGSDTNWSNLNNWQQQSPPPPVIPAQPSGMTAHT